MVNYAPGLSYTIPYKLLINKDGSYNEKNVGLVRRFSWYNDVVILIPSESTAQDGLALVKYLTSMRVRSPKVTYIVYSPLISTIEDLEGIVESM